jgi:hypothetical protein
LKDGGEKTRNLGGESHENGLGWIDEFGPSNSWIGEGREEEEEGEMNIGQKII